MASHYWQCRCGVIRCSFLDQVAVVKQPAYVPSEQVHLITAYTLITIHCVQGGPK